jgi:prophage regulatory protein
MSLLSLCCSAKWPNSLFACVRLPQHPAQVPPSTPARMLRIPDVVRRVGLGRSTVWRMVQEKTFPAPRRLGPRAVAWIEADIANWVLNRPQL